MYYWRKYEGEVLETIIIIVGYNVNNFHSSYDNIIVYREKIIISNL
jgi:hypothetical protein